MFTNVLKTLTFTIQDKAREAVKVADKYLRSSLIQWMDHVENKREVRNRLRHTGLDLVDASKTSHWINWFGYLEARFLPLKISDGDWIAFKVEDRQESFRSDWTGLKWLSCWGSVRDEDYCNIKANCPAVAGGQAASSCHGEKFQIQTTSHGPIKLNNRGANNKIAFKYAKSDKRGGGTFWLSKHYLPNIGKTDYQEYIYTMPCPGESFTQHEISECNEEVYELRISQRFVVVERTCI